MTSRPVREGLAGLLSFWGRALGVALKGALDTVQWVLFVGFLLAGALVQIPGDLLRGRPDFYSAGEILLAIIASWRAAVTLLGAIVAARLVWAPYHLWSQEAAGAAHAREQLAAALQAADEAREAASVPPLPPPEVVTLPTARHIRFDCKKGRNFRVKVDTWAELLPPDNPIEGTYRLTIMSGSDRGGLTSVSGKYRWIFAETAGYEAGDVTIYEVDIFETPEGFAYAGRPLYTARKTQPPVRVAATEMNPVLTTAAKPFQAWADDLGPTPAMAFDSAKPSRAVFAVNWPTSSPGRIRFRVHWSHQRPGQTGSVVFALSGLKTTSVLGAPEVLVSGESLRGGTIRTTEWSAFSDAPAYTPQKLVLERVISDPGDTLADQAMVHAIELQPEPRPG